MIAVRKLPARYASIVMPFVLSILHDGRGVGHFHPSKPRRNAGVPRDLAGRLGAVMARRLSDAADGAATGPPDRG